MAIQETSTPIFPIKRVLISGANSYIGQSFEKWVKKQHPDCFEIDTLDMLDPNWKHFDFSKYDSVFHVAGIAHADIGHVTEERKQLYYTVNSELAKETCKLSKKAGVKQFVFMSSIIIYGESAGIGKSRIIDSSTIPTPANFYGDSKWQGDRGVRAEASEGFNVAVVRPPMIYGKGSKGNYPTLSKLAQKLPVFPSVKNERSMLHIDNLCEFLYQLMVKGIGGIFFPQNAERVGTSEMVKLIANEHSKKVLITPLFNWAVWLFSFLPGKPRQLVNKAFGSLSYEPSMSVFEDTHYQIRTFEESIRLTEGVDAAK